MKQDVQGRSDSTNNYIDDFITIGELKKMLEPFNDCDYITVTKGHADWNHRITHIEDCTVFGFWKLRTTGQEDNTNNFIDDFITIGELRKMLEPFDDDEYITVTKGHADLNHKITHIEDCTAFGFWELRFR